MKANQKTFALWFALIVLTIFMFRAWDMKNQKSIQDFNYSKLLRAVELKEIVDKQWPGAKLNTGITSDD